MSLNCKLLPDKGYERLEPDVVKVASPVLRRGRASNRFSLFGKTHITHIDDGFDFLGWNFRKYGGKLLIKPSKKSIGNITRKIGDVIKRAKAWKQEKLINVLSLWQNGCNSFKMPINT